MGGISKSTSIAALLLLAGCASDSPRVVVNRLVSPEQELADLARAREAGAITPDEYTALRRKLLVGN
ncbi:SHOCT domain-containing protein [Azospirillum sp. sgz301742]